MPWSGAAVIRKMPADFPDTFCGFFQPQGLVVAEIRYEEFISGRMWDHLVRMGRKLSVLVQTGTAK